MMKERTLRVLEFTKIRERLASKALTPLGAEKCQELSAIIGGQQIANHVMLQENVFHTTYENGVQVITNYTAMPYESASGVVEAGTYLLVQEGGAL